jgi:hypothetical protein
MQGGSAWLALWLGVVILCGGILLSRESRMFAETRYQIALAPALCLLWGRALAGLWRWRRAAGWIGVAALVGVMLLALPWDWRPENRREDWRDAAAFIDQHSGKNDAVVVQPDYVHPALDRYLRGGEPMFFPFTDVIRDPARVDPPLAGLAGYDAVWLVQSHYEKLDPQNLVAGWFGARFPEITEIYPTGIVIHEYLQHYRMPAVPAGVPRVDVTLGSLHLLGCAYTPEVLPAHEEVLHPPSNWVHVAAYWTAAGQVTGSSLPAARVVDASGQVWGDRLDRPGDAYHVWPPSRWLSGEVVRADTDVNLNPVTPPGSYRVVIEVPGVSGSATCGSVQITR